MTWRWAAGRAWPSVGATEPLVGAGRQGRGGLVPTCGFHLALGTQGRGRVLSGGEVNREGELLGGCIQTLPHRLC